MFQPNEEIRGLIDALYDRCESLDRGDILTHETIREVLGCEPHTGHWQYCVDVTRRRLQDQRGIATLPETTVGYKLLTTQETLEVLPRHRTLKARRQHRRARRSLEALPEKGLSTNQRRARMLLIEMARRAEAAARAELKEQAEGIRATPVPPRRPRPEPVSLPT